MSSTLCLRCLTRAVNRVELSSPDLPRRAAFSTSRSSLAQPKPVKRSAAAPAKNRRTLRLSKNVRASTGRPPDAGERKAIRKRVVLSNSNAVEVSGLEDLTVERSSPERLRELQGTVLGLSSPTVDSLRALEAFKPSQGWSLFWRPASLVTKDTIELAADLDAAGGEKERQTVRKVLCGPQSSGKSVLQLQTLAMAQLKGWIVIHIPEAQELTNAQTSYQPIETDQGTHYTQPHYTAKLLENIGKANEKILSQLQLTQEHGLPIPVQSNISLARFLDLGAKDLELSWPVWQAFLKELQAPPPSPRSDGSGKPAGRPPVLFTLDGADHIMRASAYLNADAQPIHAHDLALVQSFVGLLSGRTELPNGGVVLAAVSESNHPAAPTFRHALADNMATQEGVTPPKRDPYDVVDEKVRDALKTVRVQRVQGLSKMETRGVMEYYARSGMLKSTVTENLVSEKWALSGGGIVGQIERASVRASF